MIRVLNALFDDRYGGPQKRVIDVGKGLLEQGVETVLLLPDGDGNTAGIASDSGLHSVKLAFNRMPKPKEIMKVLRWGLLLPGDVYKIVRVIKAKEIDVVHVNGAFFLAPALAAKISGRALVWHLNDTIVSSGLARVLSLIVRILADEIVVAAEAVAAHYYLGQTAYHVIYAPVDVKRIHCKSSYAFRGTSKRVGLVGNWNPLKGLDVFVLAASAINAQMKDVEFVIAGSRLQSHIDYAQTIDTLIAKKELNNVLHCNGFIEDMVSFLGGLDVLILSSWSEACPMAVLEAMAAGVPVVATDVGGVKELLCPETNTSAGFVVPIGDSSKIAEKALELLMNEEMCEKFGLHGRKAAKSFFALEICQQKHKGIYQKYFSMSLYK